MCERVHKRRHVTHMNTHKRKQKKVKFSLSISHILTNATCAECTLGVLTCTNAARSYVRVSTPVPNTCEQAAAARDALCKYIYNQLFQWLVHRINNSLLLNLPNHGGGGKASRADVGTAGKQSAEVAENLDWRGGGGG